MTCAYIADSHSEERSALRRLLQDMDMEVVGESGDWFTTLSEAPVRPTDMLLVDWDLLPISPNVGVEELRMAYPAAFVILLISHIDIREQAALSASADAFISKTETPERVAERIRSVVAGIRAR